MEIAPNLHQLTIPFVVPTPGGNIPRFVNLFLYAGERLTLIDSGVAGAEQHIFRFIRAIGRSPEEIDTLILTHSHPDHIGAARTIRDLSGCRVLVHAAEQDWVEDTELQCCQRPVPGFATLVAGSVPVDQILHDGDCLALGTTANLHILHTPGHSAGSITLWDQQRGCLICGDAVPVPHELPVFDNVQQSLASLARIGACNADMLLSAWAEPVHAPAVQTTLQEAADWLRRVESVVQQVAGSSRPDPLELCSRVVAELGLPPLAVNPIMARTCMACL